MAEMKRTKKDIEWLRKETSRLSSIANKRIKRLQENNEVFSQALQGLQERGKTHFGIKGKNNFQVQQEYNEVVNFLNSMTSTVSGAKKIQTEIQSSVGIKEVDVKADMSTFFDIASEIEKALEGANNLALARDYQRTWKAINEYRKKQKIEISNLRNDARTLEGVAREFISQLKRDYPKDVQESVSEYLKNYIHDIVDDFNSYEI